MFWINFKKALPDDDKDVLVVAKGVKKPRFAPGKSVRLYPDNYLYWMPVPRLPVEMREGENGLG